MNKINILNITGGARNKEVKGLANKEVRKKDNDLIMVPEKYNYGKCGADVGFCHGSRYCNKDGECGEENTHKMIENNNNYKYRFCNSKTDNDCIKQAMCTGDKTSEIKCRLNFKTAAN